MRAKLALALLAPLTTLLSSCSFAPPAFSWSETETHVRLDPVRNVFEWTEITHGLSDPGKDAAEQLRDVLAGARVFPAAGGWASLSLDEPVRVPLLFMAELAPTVSVVDAQLVLDENNDPSLWRRMRIESASEWLRGFLAWIAEDDPADTPDGLPEGLELDAASVTRLQAEMLQGFQLWKLDGGTLMFEAPTTPEAAARFIEATRARPPEVGQPPTTCEYQDGWLRMRLMPDASGWIRLSRDRQPSTFTVFPSEPLGDIGLVFESSETYVQLRRDAGLD